MFFYTMTNKNYRVTRDITYFDIIPVAFCSEAPNIEVRDIKEELESDRVRREVREEAIDIGCGRITSGVGIGNVFAFRLLRTELLRLFCR